MHAVPVALFGEGGDRGASCAGPGLAQTLAGHVDDVYTLQYTGLPGPFTGQADRWYRTRQLHGPAAAKHDGPVSG